MQQLKAILSGRHRLLRVWAAAVILGVVATAAPAGAGSSRSYGSPYDSYGGTNNNCTSGATCRPDWAATAQGSVRAAASYARSAATTGDAEYTFAYGAMSKDIVLPAKTSSAAVTFLWRVTRAASVASAGKGFVYSGTAVSAGVSCGNTCSAPRAFAEISAQCAAASGCNTRAPHSVTGQTISLRINLSNISSPVIRAFSSLSATSSGNPQCLVYLATQCQTLDSSHSGKASSSIDARLLSIQVTTS